MQVTGKRSFLDRDLYCFQIQSSYPLASKTVGSLAACLDSSLLNTHLSDSMASRTRLKKRPRDRSGGR
jgi:hypothetical protein